MLQLQTAEITMDGWLSPEDWEVDRVELLLHKQEEQNTSEADSQFGKQRKMRNSPWNHATTYWLAQKKGS